MVMMSIFFVSLQVIGSFGRAYALDINAQVLFRNSISKNEISVTLVSSIEDQLDIDSSLRIRYALVKVPGAVASHAGTLKAGCRLAFEWNLFQRTAGAPRSLRAPSRFSRALSP